MRRLLACLLPRHRRSRPRTGQGDAALGPVSPPAAHPPSPVQKPTVEADISTRTIEVTRGSPATEIIVFGAVDNSQAPHEPDGYYDVVVVVEGTPFPSSSARNPT